jgi:ATP-dependent DNA ligase
MPGWPRAQRAAAGRPACPTGERRRRQRTRVAGAPARSERVRGYEGLVAKEEASLYEAGPTRRWLKVKEKGWTDGQDRWKRRIGA